MVYGHCGQKYCTVYLKVAKKVNLKISYHEKKIYNFYGDES